MGCSPANTLTETSSSWLHHGCHAGVAGPPSPKHYRRRSTVKAPRKRTMLLLVSKHGSMSLGTRSSTVPLKSTSGISGGNGSSGSSDSLAPALYGASDSGSCTGLGGGGDGSGRAKVMTSNADGDSSGGSAGRGSVLLLGLAAGILGMAAMADRVDAASVANTSKSSSSASLLALSSITATMLARTPHASAAPAADVSAVVAGRVVAGAISAWAWGDAQLSAMERQMLDPRQYFVREYVFIK